jgi:hypothetical protein
MGRSFYIINQSLIFDGLAREYDEGFSFADKERHFERIEIFYPDNLMPKDISKKKTS